MKRLALALSLFVALSAPAFADPRETDSFTLAVLDFAAPCLSADESMILTEQVASYIAENGVFRIIDRSKRDAILEEIEFSSSGASDEKSRIELGRLLSAAYLLSGNIGNIGESRYWMNMKLIDASSGEVARSISKEYKSLPALLDDCRKLTLALVDPERHGDKEYVVRYGPEGHSTFDFIGGGYHRTDFAFRTTDGLERELDTDGVSLVMGGIRGSDLVFQWMADFYVPLRASMAGEAIELGTYVFPWGVDVTAGPGLLLKPWPRVSFLVGLDAHYTQLTLWPTKDEADMAQTKIYITFGLGAGASVLVRVKEAYYLRLGCSATYDLVNVLTSYEEFMLGGSFDNGVTLLPYLLIGSAK